MTEPVQIGCIVGLYLCRVIIKCFFYAIFYLSCCLGYW